MHMARQLPLMARLAKVHLTHKRRLQSALQPHGITLKQMYVLRQLLRRGDLNPSVIADELYCDRPTATVIISNMERRGWVRRKADPESKRRVLVELTKDGRRKLEEIRRASPDDGFDPLDALGAEEREQLEALLVKIQRYQEEESEKNVRP